jgi:glycosyltransferase involved in cell wall biosynthesis
MKILVFAHRFEIGGSQVNAIDLAETLRDVYGHEIVIFAEPGPMVKVAEERGLRFIPAPIPGKNRIRTMGAALYPVLRKESPDIVHAWDYWQYLDSYFIARLGLGIPMVVSDMISDHMMSLLPKFLPLTFGTPERVDWARRLGMRRAKLLVPPVDVRANAPGAADENVFRNRHGVGQDELLVVTISRVVKYLKRESLLRSMDAVEALAAELPIRQFIIGDGDLLAEVRQKAGQINARVGREVITAPGEMVDPRPAYAAADIVVGMGGSALRAMCFAKPVIVVGENGFSSVFNPNTSDSFYYKGIYGKGDGDIDNRGLIANLRQLAHDPGLRASLGRFSRDFVVGRFSVEKVSADLDAVLKEAVEKVPPYYLALYDGIRTASYLYGETAPPRVKRIFTKAGFVKQRRM